MPPFLANPLAMIFNLHYPLSGNVNQNGWTNAGMLAYNYGQIMGRMLALKEMQKAESFVKIQEVETIIPGVPPEFKKHTDNHANYVKNQIEDCDKKLASLRKEHSWLEYAP